MGKKKQKKNRSGIKAAQGPDLLQKAGESTWPPAGSGRPWTLTRRF